MTALSLGLFGAGWIVQIAAWFHRVEMFWPGVIFAVASTISAALAAAEGDFAFMWFCLACAVINAIGAWFWWNRRKRRRGPRAIGAKARARIAAMTARMRERPARPVLRPVPGGAR